jgi:DNA polymerase III epsilon subunit-like protein
MDYKKICVLDLETTGTTTDDAPIQVAGLLVNENGEVLSSFEEKIKTTHIISPGASAVNGIYKEDLANCRTEIPVLTDFAS